MARVGIILFAVSILCSGCRTTRSEYSPEAWVAWQKCLKVKDGMTYSQVYAILPSTGRYKIRNGPEMEDWWLGGGTAQDHVLMSVEYGPDGRVIQIDRAIEHGMPIAMPPQPVEAH
jgi:hypothetical protein